MAEIGGDGRGQGTQPNVSVRHSSEANYLPVLFQALDTT